jgi:hypothetical protein
MMARLSTVVTSIIFAVLLMGCASHPPKVNCEEKLRPINPPAPVVHSDDIRHEG